MSRDAVINDLTLRCDDIQHLRPSADHDDACSNHIRNGLKLLKPEEDRPEPVYDSDDSLAAPSAVKSPADKARRSRHHQQLRNQSGLILVDLFKERPEDAFCWWSSRKDITRISSDQAERDMDLQNPSLKLSNR